MAATTAAPVENGASLEKRESQQHGIDALADTSRWTPEQVGLLKNTVARGATNDELRLFATVCARTRLDPFIKQIHFVKRWDSQLKVEVGAFQTGIDGFRVIAARTGKYRGRIGPQWCGQDGAWVDLWTSDEPPFAARCAVVNSDFHEPQWATVRWSAYAQTKRDGGLTRFWLNMGPEQLGKCAEAAAHRIAFPNDLSGLYEHSEMDQAEEEKPGVRPRPAVASTAGQSKLRTEAEESLAEVLTDTVGEGAAEESPDDMDGAPAEYFSQDDPVEMLVHGGVELMIMRLSAMRLGTKGERHFYGERDGRQFLMDGALLTAIGSVRNGAPVNAWLDKLFAQPETWRRLAFEVLKASDEIGIGRKV